ncbi:hypothetical protein LB456_13235 [Psychroflexus sp. CAK57W]|uniref:hypothetical protein n=1 Tax=Psychroflexus curvus TaxID=2873595 RepID=UPI001CCC7ECC|nr:hypothetical protein [Psychroflexus curvus]MBZ9628386.1 hypothetical protein [Psychroflexus curvus]MBZ9788424.1 hypothetical protein [Psychroflexus curvus]
MKNNHKNWTKEELKIYILLVCAKADDEISPEEIKLIQLKTSQETFDKIYTEFKGDKNEKRLKKIERVIGLHHYGSLELLELRKEIFKVYLADNVLSKKERYLDQIFDNIIY